MRYFLLTFIIISNLAFSQIAVGKSDVESASSSLEFGSENRGLVLPWTTSAASINGVVNGTMIFDINDKKVKIYTGNVWKDLTVAANGTVDTTLQDGLTEQPGAKISFGASGSTPGLLVLEDTNRAMILPKVASPHLNIVSPAAGMMVYDTVKKMLLVFNGTVWTFWKAS